MLVGAALLLATAILIGLLAPARLGREQAAQPAVERAAA